MIEGQVIEGQVIEGQVIEGQVIEGQVMEAAYSNAPTGSLTIWLDPMVCETCHKCELNRRHFS